MNAVDLSIVGALFVGLVAGAASGFVRTAMGLASFVGGAAVALAFSDPLSSWFAVSFGLSGKAALVAAVVTLVLAVGFAAFVVSLLVRGVMRLIPPLGWFDKLAGAALGLALSLAVSSAALHVVSTIAAEGATAQAIRSSRFAGSLAGMTPWVLGRFGVRMPEMSELTLPTPQTIDSLRSLRDSSSAIPDTSHWR